MKISEIIDVVKKNCKGYGTIDETKTRDKVLYGDVDKQCTGIVTTIYASYDVIKKASELGANFIIAHEALFWNHGDHTDWLKDNETFKLKKQLLDETGITVWRDHDYIHSGIMHQGRYVDGIFYGLAYELDWLDYISNDDANRPQQFTIPKTPTREVAQYLMEKMNLKGMKTMGNIDGYTEKIYLPFHIIGEADNRMLSYIEENHVDTILAMEITDFTVAIYMRDGAQAGLAKSVLAAGHFNVEEPGMKWFAEKHLPTLIKDIPVNFIQAGDSYTMLLRK
ncbi:MAG: Nif3-like dinuclear metal center hexameric protein [Erysipelotrichaceae bacterium]|nr:Nif3-like dinuclear metal center hexameric protein [Erysipelotrichaceae bacterium]